MRCFRCLDGVLSLDGTLDAKQTRQRTLFFTINVAVLMSTLAFTVAKSSALLEGAVQAMNFCLVNVISAGSVALVLCRVRLTTCIVVSSAALYAIAVCMADLNARTKSNYFWPALVLVVDFLLVMQVQARYSVGLVVVTVMWLLVLWMEERWRWGILDLPGLVPQGGPTGRRELLEKTLRCEVLPCASDTTSQLVTALQVFLMDFVATRGFARDILKEQDTTRRTIATVQQIASLLAGYDVEKVAELLEEHGGELPEGMAEALRALEENLRKYRPYLPAALFEEDEQSAGVPDRHMSAAPAFDSETATIVFTDIRASTSIWENAPDGMSAGLKIHNRVMREVMAVFGGYEVKTIGDAFMIAFETTADGVNFALQVHEKLLAADWPASLLEDAPICTPQDSLWGGLTVRIGVNTGPVTVEQNTLTGRTDYFGHTVNVASRLESTCMPGAVAVPSDLWTSDCAACSGVVGETEALELKGVSGTTFVCPVWPVSLEGRKNTPLVERNREGMWLKCMSASGFSASGSSNTVGAHQGVQRLAGQAHHVSVTIATAELSVSDESSLNAFHDVSSGLATLIISLDQSRGHLQTVLGSRVCVSWNVTRSAPAHMENAVRFAQRMLAKGILNGAGFVTGPVQHGDVGARTQRFVTVMGGTVRRSWTLCAEAVRDHGVCLFEPEGDTLPTSLHNAVALYGGQTGVYYVLEGNT